MPDFGHLIGLSRLIAIYDVHIKLTWSGKAIDGSVIDGKLGSALSVAIFPV